MDKSLDDFLSHFGVKGMKWGVRKDHSTESRVAKLDKTISRNSREKNYLRKALPAPSVMIGAGARADASRRVLKLDTVKNPDGSTRSVYGEKSIRPDASNIKKYNRKITANANAKYISSGATFAAGILLVGKIGSTVLASRDHKMADLVSKGSKLLAGLQAAHTTMTVASIMSDHSDSMRDIRVSEAKSEKRKLLR